MKILIAEDEALQRRAIERVVRAAVPRAEVLGAEDGTEAVELCRREQPAAAFLDIRMPGVDGLEAARLIRAASPGTSLFILTAFEQFAYAQQALALGVEEYLLKPVDPAEIERCLGEVRERLRAEAAERQRAAQVNQVLAAARPLIRARFVDDLCRGAITSSAEYKRRAALLDLSDGPDQAISIGLGGLPDAAADRPAGSVSREAELEVCRRQATTAIEELGATSTPPALVGRIAHDEVAVLIKSRRTRASGPATRSAGGRLVVEILDRCHALNLAAAAGVGPVVGGALEVWRSYRGAVRARQEAWLVGRPGRHALDAADLGGDEGQWESYPLLAERGLTEAVRTGLADEVRRYLQRLVPFFGAVGVDHEAAVPRPGDGWPAANGTAGDAPPPAPPHRSRAIECLALLSRAASEGGAPAAKVLAANARSIEGVLRATRGEELAGVIIAAAVSLAETVAAGQTTRRSGLAARAAAYLEAHFPEQISLTDMAGELHISPFYLSHVFRQTMGVTFSEYLTGVRIKEAKRLLTTTNLTVGEIAARVGYREANYFGRVFKKTTGRTPVAWRKGG